MLLNTLPEDEIIEIVTGMALGIDTIWALVGIKLKKSYPNRIKMVCYVPCMDHSSNWKGKATGSLVVSEMSDIERHQYTIDNCDEVNQSKLTFKKDGPKVMQIRNVDMLKSLKDNDIDCVYAVWDGSHGGTGNCVNSSIALGLPLYWLHPFSLEFRKRGHSILRDSKQIIEKKEFSICFREYPTREGVESVFTLSDDEYVYVNALKFKSCIYIQDVNEIAEDMLEEFFKKGTSVSWQGVSDKWKEKLGLTSENSLMLK